VETVARMRNPDTDEEEETARVNRQWNAIPQELISNLRFARLLWCARSRAGFSFVFNCFTGERYIKRPRAVCASFMEIYGNPQPVITLVINSQDYRASPRLRLAETLLYRGRFSRRGHQRAVIISFGPERAVINS